MMTRVLTIAKSARRRRRVRALLRTFGRGMVFASIVGVVTVLVDRGFSLGLGWLALCVPGVVMLLICMVPALLRRDSLENAAAELDENLHLADRISTGVAFADLSDAGPFETLAQRDAEEAARAARVRDGVPVGLSRSHRWWPVLTAVAVALAVWLPARRVSTSPLAPSAAEVQQRAEERDRVAEQLEDASMLLDEQPELFDDETRRELEALEQIERELAMDETDPEEAAARAAEALSDAAERLEEEAAREQEALDATTERFADTGDDPLGEALAEGDYERAAEELAALREALESASEGERQQMAQRMRELAESIDTSAQEEPPTAAERLESEGMDPQTAQELGEAADSEDVREALESEGVDPIDAQRVSEQLKKDAQQREAQRQSQQNARKMQESLEECAGECENPSGSPGGSNAQGGGQGQEPGAQQNEPTAFGNAEQLMRELGDQSQSAQSQRQAAETMRQSANELAQGESKPSASQGGGAGEGSARVERTPPTANDALRTEALDVRRPSDSTRVRAEVEAEGPAVARRGASPEQAERTLRDAAPSAERALENQGVPARYRDLVRRYFRQRGENTPAPAAPPADDDS